MIFNVNFISSANSVLSEDLRLIVEVITQLFNIFDIVMNLYRQNFHCKITAHCWNEYHSIVFLISFAILFVWFALQKFRISVTAEIKVV